MEYYELKKVRLTPGSVYYDRQQDMNAYLLSVSDDSMLYNFRKASGLPTGDAAPMTGWEEVTGKLRGHSTGHYLSGLALAYAVTGDARYRDKSEYLVRELAKCQDAFAAGGKTAPGFLSAYDETQFDQLEELTPYPEIWAPYYTLDKIMSGLFDCYVFIGNAQALAIEEAVAEWIRNRLSKVSEERRNEMWSMYIAGEYGGMIGTLARLCRVTGKREYLETAALFFNRKLFESMERGVDVLPGMHANQHIPQIIGAAEVFRVTGEEKFFRIAKNFWDIVTEAHQYVFGGVGEAEMFREPFAETRYLTEKSAESCASYNMLRLTGLLFSLDRRARWMDYYENTLLNHIMTSASHKDDGGTIYFLPTVPGRRKEFSTDENTCCRGTGMESRYRFIEHIYSRDKETVYINLLIPSSLRADVDIDLLVEEAPAATDAAPARGEMVVTVSAADDFEKNVMIRWPAWAGNPPEDLDYKDGYVAVAAGMKQGEAVSIRLPMDLRIVKAASDASYANVSFGPYLLAGLSEEKTWIDCPDTHTVRRAKGARTVSEHCGGDLVFDAGRMRMIPITDVDAEAYHLYFRQSDIKE